MSDEGASMSDEGASMSDENERAPLLDVRDLRTEFVTDGRVVRAVDGITLSVRRGEIVGIVGESGSGKSAASLSILGLLSKNGRIASGSVAFDGALLTRLSHAEMRKIRGRRIAMVFQDPMTSLNPYLHVGEQLAEVGRLHLGLSNRAALSRARELLTRVGIPDAEARLGSHPHELSGGMRQRVMIAMALLCDPSLLIADEPTTALDVTIQAQILALFQELVRERGLSVILITHDLGVVSQIADRVCVMYAGRFVETGPARAVLTRPFHPYTLSLLRSVPRIDETNPGPLESIGGLPPPLDRGPFRECSFAPRCRFVHAACHIAEPALIEEDGDRSRRCVLPKEQVI